MAYDILVNGEDITKMEIEFAPTVTKKYSESRCKALGVEIPDGFEKIAEE